MKDEQLAKVPTLERYESDLDDWEQMLLRIRSAIDYVEQTGDSSGFISARKDVATMLDEIGQARHFIAVKRSVVDVITPDVETLFEEKPVEVRQEKIE